MTELEKAANEFAGVNYDCEDEGDSFYHMIQKEAFIAGAEWQKEKDIRDMLMSDCRNFEKCYELGKKEIIDKACEFIQTNVREYHKSGVFHVAEFIKDIKKVMEE